MISDLRYMRSALGFARRGLGRTAPNPAVGCILVKDGRVIGRGVTAPGGRPHAERIALDVAGDEARGATAYVTLEPCSHEGESGPCATALVKAGVRKVVVATLDSNPLVSGSGCAALQVAGIDVITGVEEQGARSLNGGFFSVMEKRRPEVTLKIAMSADGKITTGIPGEQWITGQESRRLGHLMRARTDAILVGIGTALADDPSLDCRLEGLEGRSPLRIVLDSRARLPSASKLVRTADRIPLLWVTNERATQQTPALGVTRLSVPDCRDLDHVLVKLAERGITRLLVEGGSQIHGSFVNKGLVDRLAIFKAPHAIGGSGLDAIHGVDINKLDDVWPLIQRTIRPVGEDTLVTYVRRD